MKYNISAKEVKAKSLSEVVCSLRDTCRTVKKIDPDNVSPQIQCAIEMLERQVQDCREAMKASDKLIWQNEMELSKGVHDIEGICRVFNAKLVELGLYPLPGTVDIEHTFKIDAQKNLAIIREFLDKLARDLQAEEKRVQEDRANAEKQLHSITKELEGKEMSLAQTSEESQKKTKDKDTTKNKIENEEHEYKERLSALKNNLMMEKSKERKDLKAAEAELQLLEEQEKVLLKKQEKDREEGHVLMVEAPKQLMQKREASIRTLNEYFASYEKAVNDKVAAIEAENEEIKQFTQGLPKLKTDTEE